MSAGKEAIFPGQQTATGAYSPGIACGEMVFVSGQGPLDPLTSGFITGDIDQQTRLTLDNVRRVLEASGSCLDDCVKVGIYLQNINDFARFNAVYERAFAKPLPARTTVQAVLGCGI